MDSINIISNQLSSEIQENKKETKDSKKIKEVVFATITLKLYENYYPNEKKLVLYGRKGMEPLVYQKKDLHKEPAQIKAHNFATEELEFIFEDYGNTDIPLSEIKKKN